MIYQKVTEIMGKRLTFIFSHLFYSRDLQALDTWVLGYTPTHTHTNTKKLALPQCFQTSEKRRH